MNKSHNGGNYGFTQYCYAKDFELSGKCIVLTDVNNKHILRFKDNEFIEYTDKSGETLSQYEALKIDDKTHIVFFGEYMTVAVLDYETGYAVISDSKCEDYYFCTIDGCAVSGAMPGYTVEMEQTHVKWYFGCERYLENTYNADGTCTCIWSPRTDRPRKIPAKYIRIKEAMYLCQLDSTSPFRTDLPQGFSKIIMLQCYKHLVALGCIYSPTLNEFRPISGYAIFPE